MKKWFVCLLCLLLLAGCGKASPEPAVVAGDPEQTEASRLDLAAEIHAETKLSGDDVQVEPLEKEGVVYGFDMRFRKTASVDSILSNPENLYFGVLECGKQRIAVAMEEIRVLPDIPTGSLVVTLLVPEGAKLSGDVCRVCFYAAARDGSPENALFGAEKEAKIA